MRKIRVSWQEFDRMANELVEQIIIDNDDYDGIFAVPCGGLTLGVVLHHKLKLPLLLWPTEKSLIVDEINDTGRTLNGLIYKKCAVLYTTKWSKVIPDFFINYKNSQNDWLIFPWEDERSENGM